jgi:DNA repair protein SbcD/Mre11
MHMRIGVVADVHLDSPFRWMPPDAARRRRLALRDALTRAVDAAAADGCDVFCVAGDLYEHDMVGPDTAEFLRSCFAGTSMRVVLAPGNHDWYGPSSLYHRVDWSPNVHVFDRDHLVPLELDDGLTLWGAAHRAPRGTAGFLDDFHVDRAGVNLALFHGSEQGALAAQGADKEAHAPFTALQVDAAGLDGAMCGHYHRPAAGPRHAYPGNLEPLAFGDPVGGLLLVEVADDGRLVFERRAVAEAHAHDIEVDVTGCGTVTDVRTRVRAELQGLSGVARVTLVGELPADVDLRPDDCETVAEWLDAVVARTDRIRTAIDVAQLTTAPTVEGEFVRRVLGAGLGVDEERRVLLTGLRALAGRDDLEVA